MAKKVGRPTSYNDEYAEQARKLCLLGATDKEMADFFGVSVTTVDNWKKNIPEFVGALKEGKVQADVDVANSLYQRATGYEWTEQQAIKVKVGQYEEKVELVEVRKATPPDTTAGIFWLKNRRKADWRDKQEHGFTDPDGNALSFTVNLVKSKE